MEVVIGKVLGVFENNKNKLEKAMHVASRISFSANQSDKMFNKAGNGDGL